MKLKKFSLLLICAIIGFVACKKDDDGDVEEFIPRDRAEQQVADMDSIGKYLDSHYVNLDELLAKGGDAGIEDIVIVEVEEDDEAPDGYTLLRDAVGEPKSLTYADVAYQYYVLEINEGGGEGSPTFADTVQILYEGSLLDGTMFDSKYVPDNNPLDLTGLIKGWQAVIPNFNIAESYVENSDGTVDYYNSGLGVMIIPSGLAYFYSSTPGESYAPLVFKFELLDYEENDHDGDGIPSYLEDLNSNGESFTADG